MLDCNSFAVLYAISDFVTGNKHPCKHILDTYLIMFIGEISRSGIAGQRACKTSDVYCQSSRKIASVCMPPAVYDVLSFFYRVQIGVIKKTQKYC